MKTKQCKEESDKSIDEDSIIEPKTRGRKKAIDSNPEEEKKSTEEPKPSKEPKKNVGKPRAIIKKRPLGIRKTLRSKKVAVAKDKLKNVVKQTGKRGRKPAVKPETVDNSEKEALIPVTEIKKEPVDDTTPSSRSSSPKTAGRRQRINSDMAMMKSVLAESPNNLVLGPRTSPYSMRSERSNSPSMFETKNLRSGKPRKVKSNLLNEVVMKEQKKRRRLLSDSKADVTEAGEECKKLKRGRSCSGESSEISKCSEMTESDISLNETLNDTDSKELNKKLEKSKTDLDIDIENNIQISTVEQVPSLNNDSKLAETKPDTEPSNIAIEKNKSKLSLKRSTSLDSDNNNSNRLILLDNLNAELGDKLMAKTENDNLLDARSSILDSMSKTFNSKEMCKNIRKARRGRKAAAASRPTPQQAVKPVITSTITNDKADDNHETIETLSQEIDNLINNLDKNIDGDQDMANESNVTEKTTVLNQTKTVSKFYGLSKPLGDNNSIVSPETPVKDKDVSITPETTPSKIDDSENIRLHYEEDSVDRTTDNSRHEITYQSSGANIDKLMYRLKELEEFDKRRQKQESESKVGDGKTVMVSNDVVLIPKSGADIKPLKDIQSVKSPERPLQKENVLSNFFENNSAISIVKRDQARKSVDLDLPNSVTLIKRNSMSARKESTSSNHSKESDAISIFEKSLGKDVTLTEIRKSVDKTTPSAPSTPVEIHQFATLHPNNPTTTLAGMTLDSSQISIVPRSVGDTRLVTTDSLPAKRKSRESLSRKTSGSDVDEKMAVIEKLRSPPPPAINTPPPAAIKSPPPQAIKTPPPQAIKTPPIAITPTPIAVKSLEVQPVATEALPPPSENVKSIPGSTSLSSEIPKVDTTNLTDITKEVIKTDEVKMDTETIVSETKPTEEIKEPVIEEKADEKMNISVTESKLTPDKTDSSVVEQMVVDEVTGNKKEEVDTKEAKTEEVNKESAQQKPTDTPKATRSSKSARNSIESQPGPSSAIHETPESQKRKENVLRTLGLLTHKAAKEAKAKIEKQKEKDRISGPSCSGTMQYKNKAKSGDYTGTLKTVIKLSRGTDRDKKKCRSSLKMTFQKSKNRSGKPTPELGEMAEEDDAYTYTIERREGSAGTTSDGGHRKSHYSNRLNNHDLEAAPEPAESKDTPNLVIPEKASSFSIHPGRLCMDQCFYCGGKFGLFDTPCHIAQMKSSERQKKVLDNEEKLTVDSCLCDACYRHVDRRANCASYRKRGPLQPPPMPPTDTKSPPLESGGGGQSPPAPTSGRGAVCHTEGCSAVADHSIRRKWLIKMRTSVSKVLKLRYDYPGLHTIPLCAAHVAPLAPLLRCRLCRRQHKHNNLHLYNVNAAVINPWLESQHVPTSLPPRAALCKPCRHYAALAAAATANAANSATAGNVIDPFLVEHSRKLRQIYNVEEPQSDNKPQGECVPEDNKHKKKQRHKSKQRRSAEPDKQDSESSEKTTESSPEKDKNTDNSGNEGEKRTEHMEEDIETLISTNKIPVPGAVKATELPEGMDIENMLEHEMSIPFDKQTELQYLLQKQNNPTQFMQKPNLTHKSKNLLKIQTSVTGIQKPGYLQRIADKNAKRLQKLGQVILQKEKSKPEEEVSKEDADLLKNITLTDECTIETIPNKKSADINTLKNKWQMSESCMQVQKNLSLLSKKYSGEKDPKKSEHKFSNPVKRLETNPSISVRELFPGEEEMNLQCNIEFNNVREVTPEGWEKCNTTIQYDTDTKKLWSELQRPYGNQSSFLRHLILLEKYFRNGDLVLSHSATPLAANYSDSVQSRLRAYDNVATENPRKSEPAISLIEYRKKPSVNGKSLLKPSQDSDSELKKMPPPPPVLPKPKTKSDKPKKTLPPELIAINNPIQSRKQIQNVLHNIQQLVKGVSASDPTEVAAAPVVKETPREKKETPKEKPKKQKFASKPWRPTLMPITPEDLARAAREPMQVAADGRTLPTLVQVMSSGKRYHITIQDYNKMCIMRREKLQQDKEPKPKRMSTEETIVTEIQPSAILGNGGTVVQNILTETEKKDVPELGPITSNAATILKNVGLKNITIAAIPPKTATVTSQIIPSPVVTSPALIMTSTPIKIPQLGPAVSITSETILTPNLPVMSTMIMPKIPKSLTVIPQSVSATPISVSTPLSVAATPVMAVSTPANDPRP